MKQYEIDLYFEEGRTVTAIVTTGVDEVVDQTPFDEEALLRRYVRTPIPLANLRILESIRTAASVDMFGPAEAIVMRSAAHPSSLVVEGAKREGDGDWRIEVDFGGNGAEVEAIRFKGRSVRMTLRHTRQSFAVFRAAAEVAKDSLIALPVAVRCDRDIEGFRVSLAMEGKQVLVLVSDDGESARIVRD